MFSVSLLASILFLGGWHGPIPIGTMLGLTYENGPVWGYLGNLLGLLNVLAKGVVGVSVMMWVRWTLPRLRIDQVMTTCLKYCTPISAVMFLGAALWQYEFPHRNFFGLAEARPQSYAVHEGWPGRTAVAAEDRAGESETPAAPAKDATADDAAAAQLGEVALAPGRSGKDD
jgi:NADH-quinone oxidoreductase subunit H